MKIVRKIKPDPVDINAGAILYAMRSFRGLTQQKLGGHMGVSFQQIQKYERGISRMAASTLYRASRILDISVIEFFGGLEGVWPDTKHYWFSQEEMELLKLLRSVPDVATRQHIIKLVHMTASYRLDYELPSPHGG